MSCFQPLFFSKLLTMILVISKLSRQLKQKQVQVSCYPTKDLFKKREQSLTTKLMVLNKWISAPV